MQSNNEILRFNVYGQCGGQTHMYVTKVQTINYEDIEIKGCTTVILNNWLVID